MTTNFLERTQGDIEKRKLNTYVNQLKTNPNFNPAVLDQLGIADRRTRAPAKEAKAAAPGPVLVVHGSQKINEKKDHKWGPLGW